MMNVLAIDGSPTGAGRTRTVLREVLAGAASAGAETQMLGLAENSDAAPIETAPAAVMSADAFVIGSPVYRGSFATPLKAFFDVLPRGMWGETEQPLTGRAVAIVMTGASWHHYLALSEIRNVLAGFFAAHVLTPGLYAPSEAFDPEKRLVDAVAAFARTQGKGLVALARAVEASDVLKDVRPQA